MKRDPLRVHPSVTLDRIVGAVQQYNHSLDNPGICLACGADAMDCEPDAERYECDSCGERRVYGAEQLLIMGVGYNK